MATETAYGVGSRDKLVAVQKTNVHQNMNILLPKSSSSQFTAFLGIKFLIVM